MLIFAEGRDEQEEQNTNAPTEVYMEQQLPLQYNPRAI